MCSKVSVINIASSSLENAKEVTNVHLMPCRIQYDGEAKIEEYFQSTIISSKGHADGAQHKGLCNPSSFCISIEKNLTGSWIGLGWRWGEERSQEEEVPMVCGCGGECAKSNTLASNKNSF